MRTTTADFQTAFQPMIAAGMTRPYAWKAVTTTRDGRSFSAVAATLPIERRTDLEALRITLAIEAADAAGLGPSDALIAVPVSAGGGMAGQLLAHLLQTARTHGLGTDRLVVEINADERGDFDAAARLADACARRGLSVALDRFAAGPLALKLLARTRARFVKLDPALVRNIDASASRRLIVEGVMRLARRMGATVVARGADSRGEHAMLREIGIRHFEMEPSAPLPQAPRRAPRTAPPTHRRLAHHERAAPARPLPMGAPMPLAMAG